MRSLLKTVVSGVATLSLLFTTSSQAAWTIMPMSKPMPDRVDFVSPVLGPFAYTHFCMRYAADCRVHGRAFRRPRPVALNAARRSELNTVNAEVNHAIAPRRYVNDYSFDTWRIAPQSGDCNDFAVTKRHELLAKGWPSRSLLLSEVVTTWGEHHLVLLVRTDHGNYVLDNLTPQIRPWSQTPYQWTRIQMPSEPELWATVKDPRRVPVS